MEDAVPILDGERLMLLRTLDEGNTSGLVTGLLRGFLASVPEHLGLMRQQLAAGDAVALADQAHDLAGSSGMYGLPRVDRYCRMLESRARDRQWEEAARLLAQVERAFEEAQPLLLAELSPRAN